MKLIITASKIIEKFGEEKALELIRAAGFDGIDYSFDGSAECSQRLGDDYMAYAEKTHETMQQLGLSCYQAHAPFVFQWGDTMDMSGRKYREVVHSMEYAARIGAKMIVIHAVKVPANENFLEYNLAYYRSYIPYAEKFGIKIAVENLVNSIFWLPEKLSRFIEMLDSPVFCACVDVGHSVLVGLPPESFIARMIPGIVQCVHLHDTDGKVDRHWVPYLGNHNWDAIIKALADYGFSGDMCMEIIHSFDYLDKELYLPMLEFAEKAGRLLIKKFDSCKK